MVQVTKAGEEQAPEQEKTLADVTPATTPEDVTLQMQLKSQNAAEKNAAIAKAMQTLQAETKPAVPEPEKGISLSEVSDSDKANMDIKETETHRTPEAEKTVKLPVRVGDIVWLNIADGTVRPAMLVALYEDNRADLLVIFNGSKDHYLTGGKEQGVSHYFTVQCGMGEGQWRPRS